MYRNGISPTRVPTKIKMIVDQISGGPGSPLNVEFSGFKCMSSGSPMKNSPTTNGRYLNV
jgi:hypothetical protein